MSTQAELLKDFVRTQFYPDVIVIYVGTIEWNGHEPRLQWVPLIALPLTTPFDVVQKKAASVLRRKQYFWVCQECGTRKPVGHMFNKEMCQNCSLKHGVVY